MTKSTQSRLALLCPIFSVRVSALLGALAAEGFELEVVQGLRSWNEQQAIYDKGRTAPGEPCTHNGVKRAVGSCSMHPFGATVTPCLPGYSWHNYGLAVDCAPDNPAIPGYQADWNEANPGWKRFADLAKSQGFTVGAQFRTRPDLPHIELTGRFPAGLVGTAGDEVRQIFKDGGMEAVWKESGI